MLVTRIVFSSSTSALALTLRSTSVSTFFFVGDTSYVANNTTPYAGLTTSLGVDVKVVKNLALGAEFYAAPYSFTTKHLDTGEVNNRPASFYTARTRIGYRW